MRTLISNQDSMEGGPTRETPQERPLRIMVIGSRFRPAVDVTTVLDRYDGAVTQIITGGSTGADASARAWAIDHDVDCKVYEPEWSRYGTDAIYHRNTLMISNGAEVLLAFPMHQSNGTQDCISKADTAGIPTTIITSMEPYCRKTTDHAVMAMPEDDPLLSMTSKHLKNRYDPAIKELQETVNQHKRITPTQSSKIIPTIDPNGQHSSKLEEAHSDAHHPTGTMTVPVTGAVPSANHSSTSSSINGGGNQSSMMDMIPFNENVYTTSLKKDNEPGDLLDGFSKDIDYCQSGNDGPTHKTRDYGLDCASLSRRLKPIMVIDDESKKIMIQMVIRCHGLVLDGVVPDRKANAMDPSVLEQLDGIIDRVFVHESMPYGSLEEQAADLACKIALEVPFDLGNLETAVLAAVTLMDAYGRPVACSQEAFREAALAAGKADRPMVMSLLESYA